MTSRKVGCWRVDFRLLQFKNIETGYVIEFSECTTSDDLLGVIFHTHKKFSNRQDTADLIEAFHRTFDPEETLWNKPSDHKEDWTREFVEEIYHSWEYNEQLKKDRLQQIKRFEKEFPGKLS